MSDSPLELLKRQIREGEERLKRATPIASQTEPSQPQGEGLSARASFAVPQQGERPQDDPSKTSEQLRILQRSFGNLLQASRDAFILVDSQGGWEPANHHLREWLGYAPEEFTGINLTQVFEPDDMEKLLASFPGWLEGREPLNQVRVSLKSKKGEHIPVLLSSYSWLNDRGERVAYLALEDERQRLALESQVSASNAFLDALMRSGGVPMFLLRRDGTILEANVAACRWLGMESNKLVNTRLQDRLVDSSHKDFEGALSRSISLTATTDIPCRLKRLTGAEFGARVSLVGVADSSGANFRVLATMDRLEIQHPEEKAASDWVAFGQMTPAILMELAQFISTSTRDVSDRLRNGETVPAHDPSLERLIQSMDRVGASLAAWAESAEFLSARPQKSSVADLLQQVITARKAELQRWGIRATVMIPDKVKECACPPSLYLVLLHILQSCLEEIQEFSGAERLVIRVQLGGERLEITFAYETSGRRVQGAAQPEVSGFAEHLRHVELRAAQKLLDSMGGALVLENINETQRAIRLNISLHALSGGAINLQTQGQGGS